MGKTRRHGAVVIEQDAWGEWAWVNDEEGNCLCEVIDGSVRADEVPAHLLEDVRSAFAWAVEANNLMECGENLKDKGPSREEELAEWNAIFHRDLGVT